MPQNGHRVRFADLETARRRRARPPGDRLAFAGQDPAGGIRAPPLVDGPRPPAGALLLVLGSPGLLAGIPKGFEVL